MQNIRDFGCDFSPEGVTEENREETCISHYGANKHRECALTYSRLFWEKEMMRAYMGECTVSLPWFLPSIDFSSVWGQMKIHTWRQTNISIARETGKRPLKIHVFDPRRTIHKHLMKDPIPITGFFLRFPIIELVEFQAKTQGMYGRLQIMHNEHGCARLWDAPYQYFDKC